MPALVLVALLVAVLSIAVVLAFASRPLLAWYLQEARSLKVEQDPGEAIITYPLA